MLDQDSTDDIGDLLMQLEALKEAKVLKARDAHEVAVLKQIWQGKKYDMIRRQLMELYIAATCSWKDVMVWSATLLEARLGIPSKPTTVVVRSNGPTKWPDWPKKK